MVVTADERASLAAKKTLLMGGNALDAAISAQNVLSVVEPQSSGLGGGGFLLYYDNIKKKVYAFDGREVASSLVKPDMFLNTDKTKKKFLKAVTSKHSIGVPGLYNMLADAHGLHGNLDWELLFEFAIKYSEGFKVTPRLNKLLTWAPHIRNNEFVKSVFYKNNKPAKIGSYISNFELKNSLKILSKDKYSLKKGLLAKKIATSMIGYIPLGDINQWETKAIEPLCKKYYKYKICGFPPPTSGGISVLQILGILKNRLDLRKNNEPFFQQHAFLEASRLSYLDRDFYIADPNYFEVPVKSLLDESYLKQRASLIKNKSSQNYKRGLIDQFIESNLIKGVNHENQSTTHISIVDSMGNAVSLTSSIEFAFGSGITIGGFFMNNQLTDFSFYSKDLEGAQIANSVSPGKKPRSSMAPTFIFDDKQNLVGIIGSPGGSRIICYVAKTIFDILYLKIAPDRAIENIHLCSRNKFSEIEDTKKNRDLINYLKQKGHSIMVKKMTSGINMIWRREDYWQGVADPRREGHAIGN